MASTQPWLVHYIFIIVIKNTISICYLAYHSWSNFFYLFLSVIGPTQYVRLKCSRTFIKLCRKCNSSRSYFHETLFISSKLTEQCLFSHLKREVLTALLNIQKRWLVPFITKTLTCNHCKLALFCNITVTFQAYFWPPFDPIYTAKKLILSLIGVQNVPIFVCKNL